MRTRSFSIARTLIGASLLTLVSASLHAQTIPAPTLVVVSPQSGNSAVVAWTLVPNANAYVLEVSSDPTFGSGSAGYQPPPSSSNGFTIPSLPAKSYARIRGGVMGTSTAGAWSPVVSLATATPPPAPTNLTAVRGTDRVTLSWTTSPGATSYRVVYTKTIGSGYILGGNSATTSLLVQGLTPGTTYYFSVIAQATAGSSPMSAPLQVITSKLLN